MNVTMKPLAVDVETAGKLLGMSETTIKLLIRTSEKSGFPKPRLISGRRVGIPVKELEEWFESRPVSNLIPPPNTGAKKPRAKPSQDAQDDQKAA